MHEREPHLNLSERDSMLPTWYRLLRMRRETHDTFSIDLARDGAGLRFAPGQFTMLYVFGVGESAISISGDPRREDVLIHTIRDVGGVTHALAQAARGTSIGVRGPFGAGWPLDAAAGRDVVIVAGGIGLAPLRPVIYELLARREDFGHVSVLYGARTPDDLLYRDEIREWRSRLDLEFEVTVDRGGGRWRGNVGVVTTLISRAAFEPGNTLVMACGPEIMMRFTVAALRERGVPAERIHLSMERNMRCAIGLCGHCQFGGSFVCKDGPVYRYDRLAPLLNVREV